MRDSAFLDAARIAPDDDSPRLAAADSLEASDPRRARFIRLSCEYANTAETDERHAVLEAELARCRPEAAWHVDLAEIRGIAWAYDRGFVGFLRASADILVREAVTVGAHPIDTLVVDAKARDAADLCASGLLTHVRALTVHGPARACRDILDSGELEGLEGLVLKSDDKNLSALLNLPVMERIESLTLQLQGNVAHAVDCLTGAGRLARLRHLELRAEPRSIPLDISRLARSPVAAGLHSLVLGSLDDVESARALEGLGGLQRLVVWDLDEAAGLELCSGPVVGRLVRLKLQHASRSAIVALATNPGATALQQLDLGGMLQTKDVVGDEGVEALTRSPHLGGLTALNLGGCAMGERGAEALAETDAFPALRLLNLQGRNRLGAGGALALSRWSSLQGVHTLYLPLKEPEPAMVLAPLLQSGCLRQLRRLDLWGPTDAAGDEVVKALAQADLPDLSHLAMARQVNSPSFRVGGARALLGSRRLPALSILWARLKKVPKAVRLALAERFLVFDSQSDSGLSSPLITYRM